MPTAAPQPDWLPALNPALAPRLNALLRTAAAFQSETTSVEPLMEAALTDAVHGRATDLHLDPFSRGWRARFRIDGRLHDGAQLPPSLGQRLVRSLRIAAGLDPVALYRPQDAGLQVNVAQRKLNVRLAFTPSTNGEKLVVRLLDPKRLQHHITELGFRSQDLTQFQNWLGQVAGLCLVTGPIGSGKTTTLYALLRELELAAHAVVTLEDPVEYPVDGVTQIQLDPAHGLDFATGLKTMLRLDPDYLLVGEMRDAESARTAAEAAASGHFLMSTLHSPDAAGIVTLLRHWAVPDHHLATVLEVVVNQRLVRRLCPQCKQSGPPTTAERRHLARLGLKCPAKVWRPAGCKQCNQTGYRGRIGVFEVWHKTEADYQQLLRGADEHSIRRQLRERGLPSVLDDGLSKVREGVTSLPEFHQLGTQPGLGPRAVARPGARRRPPKPRPTRLTRPRRRPRRD